MTLAENLQGLMAMDQPGANAEINLKVKPLTSGNDAAGNALASDPTVTGGGVGASAGTTGGGGTPGGGGGAGGLQAAQLPVIAPGTGFGQGGTSIVPENQRVAQGNPQLITHPLGARTDDIYEAAIANLQQQTQKQYADYLQELGWLNEAGQFMPGTLETEAIRQRSEIGRQREAKLQDIIEGAVRGGTVFSGRRAQLQEQGVQPYDVALGNLETQLSRSLSQRYEGLGDLSRQFELGRNALIADAAARYQASLEGGPAAAPGDYGGGGGGGGGAPAAPAPDYNPTPEQAALYDPRAAAAAYNANNIMVPKALWLSLHPGGNYDNYRNAWLRQRNPVPNRAPTYGSGGGRATVQ